MGKHDQYGSEGSATHDYVFAHSFARSLRASERMPPDLVFVEHDTVKVVDEPFFRSSHVHQHAIPSEAHPTAANESNQFSAANFGDSNLRSPHNHASDFHEELDLLKWICLHTKFAHAEIWNVGPAEHANSNGIMVGDDAAESIASSMRDRSHHSLARESSERSVEISVEDEFERALSAEGHANL
eukprot:754882-Hanusia_phi.AAC.4